MEEDVIVEVKEESLGSEETGKLRLLVVVPQYKFDNKISYSYLTPLGLGYIISSLKKEYENVDVINLNHRADMDSVLKERLGKGYDVVLTGNMAIGYWCLKRIVELCRENGSKPKIIIGGPVITSEPDIMMRDLKPDFGVVGEGEMTTVELVKAIELGTDPREVKGIIFFEGDEMVKTEARPVIDDLDSLPWPDFDSLEYGQFLDNMIMDENLSTLINDEARVYPILASRDCPYACTFCYHPNGRRHRKRNIDCVIEELRVNIRKYRINAIFIYDDLFSVDRERLFYFCDKFKEMMEDIPWTCGWACQLSVRQVDKELLEKLKDAGLFWAGYGFESYSQKVLKSMKKPITPEQIDAAFKMTMEVGIGIQANFIFGDVEETMETARETLDYWRKNCMGQIYLGFIKPYPGSEIYNHCIRKGIIKDKLQFIKDLSRYHYTRDINMSNHLSERQFKKLQRRVFEYQLAYRNFSLARKMVENKDGTFNFESACPFCGKVQVVKKARIENRLLFSQFFFCKDCRKRFTTVSLAYRVGLALVGLAIRSKERVRRLFSR